MTKRLDENQVGIKMSRKDNLIAYSIGVLLVTMTVVPLILAIMTFDLEQWLTMIGSIIIAISLAFVVIWASRREGCF